MAEQGERRAVSALPSEEELSRVLDVERRKRSWRRRWIWGGVSATAVVGVIALVTSLRAEPVRYRTAPAREEDLQVVVDAVGTAQPREVVDVGSQESGIVHAVFVDEDERVTAGQALLALDPNLLSAQEREAQANTVALRAGLLQAQAAERATLAEWKRVQALAESRAVSESEVDQARSAAEQATAVRRAAEAQLASARARLELATSHVDRTVIRSPIDGVVLTRNIDPGQSVVAALQAVTLFEVAADLSQMTLEVEIDEADIPRVQAGQRATFSVAAWPDREFEAMVVAVHLHPLTEGGVVTYEAELAADNPDGALRPGMTVTARIMSEVHPHTLTVPLAALRFAPDQVPDDLEELGLGQARLWRLVNGVPEPLVVTMGPTDGVRQGVSGPLQPGDQVILGKETTR